MVKEKRPAAPDELETLKKILEEEKAKADDFLNNLKRTQAEFINYKRRSQQEQKEISELGGTMRLGAYKCKIRRDSLAHKLYQKNDVSERHRHRWEVNPNYVNILEENGLRISGVNPEKDLVEIIELLDHPFFIASQFHPEFRSRPESPAPLFVGFVRASLKRMRNR